MNVALNILPLPKRAAHKPGKIIRVGNASVRLFSWREKDRPDKRFAISFRVKAGFHPDGRAIYRTTREKLQHPDRRPLTDADAEKIAREKARALDDGRQHANVTEAEKLLLERNLERMSRSQEITGESDYTEVCLDKRCNFYEETHSLGFTAQAALEILRAHAPKTTKTIPDVIKEFLADIEAKSKREAASMCHWRNLRGRLNNFAAEFTGPISSLSAPPLTTWLKRLPFEAKTVNHYRAAIVELVYFSRQQNYCTREIAETIASIKPYKVASRIPEPYTPKELRKLLDHAHANAPQLIAPLVLIIFCGLRTAEVAGEKGFMDWTSIDFDQRQIKVRSNLSKVGKNRYAHFPENALAWLRHYAKPSGPIATIKRLSEALTRLCVAANVPRKKNGFRAGFISHRVGQTKNLILTAAEAGTSVAKIESNYLDWPSESAARAWFAIYPSDPQLTFALKPASGDEWGRKK